MVVFVNKVTVVGKAEDFERVYGNIAEYLRTRPGLVRYQLLRSQKDPDTYFNVAEWETQEFFAAAMAEPEFRARLKLLENVIKGDPHVTDVVDQGVELAEGGAR
jgi:heme-degrading monooxygenase HmoA